VAVGISRDGVEREPVQIKGEDMNPKVIASILGVILALSGLLLVGAQAKWPDHFANLNKTFHGWGVDFTSNVPGFGIIVLGVVLVLASLLGKSAISN
jgi:hypothetical protein